MRVDTRRLFESTLPAVLAMAGMPVLSDGVCVGFDVEGAGRWRVFGSSHETLVQEWRAGRCDCEVRCDPEALERLLSGGFRAARAYATGSVVVEGDIGLLLVLRDALAMGPGAGR